VASQATILPRALGVTGTAVADKREDGDTLASVTSGALTGLLGQEQLQLAATARFRSAGVGVAKPVEVVYSLGDGSNGGLATNYALPAQVLSASILPTSDSNPVQPLLPSSQFLPSPLSRPTGSGAAIATDDVATDAAAQSPAASGSDAQASDAQTADSQAGGASGAAGEKRADPLGANAKGPGGQQGTPGALPVQVSQDPRQMCFEDASCACQDAGLPGVEICVGALD
jgi:hypothetical protein